MLWIAWWDGNDFVSSEKLAKFGAESGSWRVPVAAFFAQLG
jgi:hypothetical protein